jgi:hypothetical protein
LETQASQNSTFVIENRAELNSFKKNVILWNLAQRFGAHVSNK